jgi:N-acetylmuramoyl-L-alanine amidase
MYKFGATELNTTGATPAKHINTVAADAATPAVLQKVLASLCTNCALQRGLLALFLCTVAGIGFAATTATTISATRIWPAPIYTRVTFEAPTAISHQMLMLQNPARLVVDIETTEITPELAALAQRVRENDPYIKQIRVARNKPGTVRVVLDLKSDVKPSLFTLAPAGEYKHRLILDVYPQNPVDPMAEMFAAKAGDKTSEVAVKPLNLGISKIPAGVEPEPKIVVASNSVSTQVSTPASTSSAAPLKQTGMPPATVKPEAKPVVAQVAVVAPKVSAAPASPQLAVVTTAANKPAPVDVAKTEKAAHAAALKTAQSTAKAQLAANLVSNSLRQIIIVIDAGHGGEDPGASGRKGTKEKDVTLAIARKLKEKIDAQPNMQAVLTRDDDYFIALHERVSIARSVQADLFVSIHADAFVRPDANGASVFALSEGGATSAAARWLAARENEADLIGGVNLGGEDPYLAKTLLDLSQTASINDSLKLGKAVLAEIGGINRLHKAQVQQAGFAVLKAPDIPSILVETAFISNPDEEKRLKDKAYQGKLAEAITEGIVRYFEKNPPLARTAAVASNDRLN